MSQSIVESIVQDHRGFLWFGTEEGLNRYDGYKFTVIKNDPRDTNTISYNHITTLFVDRSGILWIGTYNGGLNRYDLRTECVTRFLHDPNDSTSLSNNIVQSIWQDHSGNLWIGTHDGLNRIAAHDSAASAPVFQRFHAHSSDSSRLTHNTVRAIAEDGNGSLWIGTQEGLNIVDGSELDDPDPVFHHFAFDPENSTSSNRNSIRTIFLDRQGTLWIGTDHGLIQILDDRSPGHPLPTSCSYRHYFNDPDDIGSLLNNEVYSIFEDRSGNLWIGTNGGGLGVFDRTRESFFHFTYDAEDPNSLSYDEIRSLYEDRSGVLWIGTYGGGVCKINRAKKKFLHYQVEHDNPNSLNQKIVWCIYQDRAGILWIGTHGGGLNRFDRVKNHFMHYLRDPDDPHSISSDIVRLIIEDLDGRLWIATHGGGLNIFNRETEKFTSFRHDPENPNSLSHNDIRALCLDRSGAMWIGTRGGGLNKMQGYPPQFKHYRNDPDDPNSISSDFIRCLHQTREGVLWIGTLGGGLDRLDIAEGTFTHYRNDPDDASTLSNDYVFAIHQDSYGILWIGTWGGGLNRFDVPNETFRAFTTKDGLPNNSIYGILEDEHGRLWISTNLGLSRFDPNTGIFRNYTVRDGLQSNEFNGGSYYAGSDGEMFFGGINGFNAFYPDSITDNPYVPPIMITSFQKLNQEAELDLPIWEIDDITLSHRDYVFSFEFTALDYRAPEMNQYAYKMEGLDKEWVPTRANKRFATYTTLSPGRYTFRVKGSNGDGVWNEKGAAVRIRITPPFYKTSWFILIFILLVLALLLLWLKWRIKTIRMQTELQTAHSAQMSIMPQTDPAIENIDISGICLPASEVGGDFFDYIWLSPKERKLGVFIGDVSGKAMEAAMTAVMASGMIGLEAHEAINVREILTRVNHQLYSKTPKQMFVTACFVTFDLVARKIIFTNAGSIEPLIKSNDSVFFLDPQGSPYPLGCIKDHVYQERELPLQAGDVVVLVTDGILEALNHNKEMYGEKRLRELLKSLNTRSLSAREIKENIVLDVRGFSGRTPQHDDITVIVIKIL